ncbi:MAG: hypothetical protein ABH818_02905 [Patescibacteria group bacterium]
MDKKKKNTKKCPKCGQILDKGCQVSAAFVEMHPQNPDSLAWNCRRCGWYEYCE